LWTVRCSSSIHARFTLSSGQCSLCGEQNQIAERYSDPGARLELPELNKEFVEFELSQGLSAFL
jgi:hypothetical protein